jgi:hypothetical protein
MNHANRNDAWVVAGSWQRLHLVTATRDCYYNWPNEDQENLMRVTRVACGRKVNR